MSGTVVAFNYGSLSKTERRTAEAEAVRIKGLLEKTGATIVEIGRRLIAVREALGPSKFAAWLAAEFQWQQPMASNYMQAARRFGQAPCLDKFQPHALYELSRSRVPDSVVDKAIEKAVAGELVTLRTAVDMVRAAGAGPAPRLVTSAARRHPAPTQTDPPGDGDGENSGATPRPVPVAVRMHHGQTTADQPGGGATAPPAATTVEAVKGPSRRFARAWRASCRV
ncbi:MAG: DUF3102 domain-containing protein [Planctomycetaceae bacterium]|nr:DUF3102 domain-containing protein [Planctomycetaceae bacterium]